MFIFCSQGLGIRFWRRRPPAAAIQLSLKAGDIDLLVADVVMPKMNGPDLYKCLLEARPGLKVLFMSGYPDVAKVLCADTGDLVGYIETPFTSESSLRQVSAALAK